MTRVMGRFSKILMMLLVVLPAVSFAAETQEFAITDLSGGLNTYTSPNQIPDNAAAVLENVFTDQEHAAVERNGYQKRDVAILGGTKAVSGLWEFVDSTGNNWIISYSSRTFYKNTVGQTPTAFGPTLTSANIPDCVAQLGKFWCTNASDSGWSFDGISTATVAGMPRGTLIEAWRTRLVVGNITGSQSTLRFSADGDGTSWTLGGNPTDPFSLQIGGANDGQNVNCLWGSYADNLVASKKRSTWYVSGFDQSDVEIRNVSSEIGCLQQGSLREFDGSMIFMSNRGLEEMQGYTIKPISEPIRDIVDPLVKNTGNTRSVTFTSDADWILGNSTPTNLQIGTSTISGSLSNKTTTYAPTLTADWNSGTFDNTVYVDTETVSGKLQTTFPDLFDSFRDGTAGTKQVWTKWANGTVTSLFAASGGVMSLHASNASTTNDAGMRTVGQTGMLNGSTIYFDIVDNSDSGSSSSMYLVGNTGSSNNTFTARDSGTRFYVEWEKTVGCASGQVKFNQFNFNLNTIPGQSGCLTPPVGVKVNLSSTEASLTVNTISGSSVIARGVPPFGATDLNQPYYLYFGNVLSLGTDKGSRIDNFVVLPETFTWTSPLVDTNISSPTWNAFAASTAGATMSFTSTASGDGVSFDGPTVLTPGTIIGMTPRRYYRAAALFNNSLSTASVLSLSDLAMSAASSGTYTSPAIFLSSSIASFGPVTITDTRGGSGSITYQINSSSYNVFNSTNWVNIISGGVPTIAVRNYVAYRPVFNVTSGTDSLSIQDIATSWNEGAAQPVVSWNYDRRYWLAYTTSTAGGATNDRILVYQRNRTWTLLSGINAASFATWRDGFYFGNSNNTGYVYNFDTGNDDDGTAITSRIFTKSYDLGQPIRRKDLKYMYLTFRGNTSNTGSFLINYNVNQSAGLDIFNHDYTLGTVYMNEGTGTVLAKMPFPVYVLDPIQGREIQYKFQKTGGERLKLYGFTTRFELMEPE